MVVKLLESPKICIEVTLFLFNDQLTAAAKTQYLGLNWKKTLHGLTCIQSCKIYSRKNAGSMQTLIAFPVKRYFNA